MPDAMYVWPQSSHLVFFLHQYIASNCIYFIWYCYLDKWLHRDLLILFKCHIVCLQWYMGAGLCSVWDLHVEACSKYNKNANASQWLHLALLIDLSEALLVFSIQCSKLFRIPVAYLRFWCLYFSLKRATWRILF